MTAARLDTLCTAQTPEGIALSLRPAGVVARAGAYLIDLLIRVAVFTILASAAGAMGKASEGFFYIAFFALEWFYPVLFELSRTGATPGKRIMGLSVVMDSGLPVTPAASLTRNLLRAADFMPALYSFGLLSMLWRADGKRLGDLAAGTLVVFTKQLQLHGELPAAAACVPQRPLSAPEQVAVVAWAGRATRLTPARFQQLAELATPIVGPAESGSSVVQRLLGVAHWLLGHRQGSGRTPS